METVNVLKEHGAENIYAACTHGILSDKAVQKLEDSCIKEFVVTNTVPIPKEKQLDKITTLDITPFFAEAIKRLNESKPLGDLFEN